MGAPWAASIASSAPLPMRVDPSFDPDHLGSEERVWYDRLLASIEASRSVVDTRASSRDLYYGGRTVGDHNAALLMALRVTGDSALLYRVAEVAELYRAELADAWLDGTTDGRLNWVWLIEPTNATYYGNDLHQADEVIMHGNVALVAYALHLNRDLDVSYAAMADFWRDYLETHFLAKWYERSGGDPTTAWEATESESGNALYRRFVVTRANQLRLAYYLWKLTDNPFYLERANSCMEDLSSHMEINPVAPTAFRWKHQISGSDLGWQKINYAQYFLRVVMEMHFEEFGDLAGTAEMESFASTFADVVFPGIGSPYTEMTERVDGTGATALSMYGVSGLSRWDETGFILERAEANYWDGLSGVSNAAYSLMAVVDLVASSVESTPEGDVPVMAGLAPNRLLVLNSRNPTRGGVSFRLYVPEASRVHVELLDVRGRRVASVVNRRLPEGVHRVAADLRGELGPLAGGVYVLRARMGDATDRQKIVLIR